MSIIVERFNKIKSNIEKVPSDNPRTIVAVSKTFSLDHIMPLINYGHMHYGENKVQEAEVKWSQIKNKNKDLKLHMIGKLQSNKAKMAVQIFDYIHSLDSQKLADVLASSQENINKSIKYFIQVNLGNEKRKGLTLCAKDEGGYYPLNTAHDGRPILMNKENLIKID